MNGDYMKKQKFRKQDKSKNHKCSQCQRKDAEKVQVSEKEVRWLCIICKKKYDNREEKETSNFIRASKLWRPKE